MNTYWSILTMCAVIQAAVAASWRDDFDAAKLHERWTWHAPAPGPTLSLDARQGWLRLSVPQTPTGFNHWVRERRAPMLKTPAPPGDWDLTARVSLADYTPESNFHLALVVGLGRGRVLAWGPFLSKRLYPDWTKPTVWAEPTGRGRYIQTKVGCDDVELQISKRVDTYYLRTRKPGRKTWQTAGSCYAGGQTPQFVGIMGKTFGNQPGSALDVDYIELAPRPAPKPQAPAAARVTIGKLTGQRMPALQRGFFLEFLGRCIFRGIWDERLGNRKFIGPSTRSGVVEHWRAVGKAQGYAPDPAKPYAEPQSQRIDLADAEAGIAQGDLALQAGRAYAVRVVVQAEGQVRRVRVALQAAGRSLAEHTFALGGRGWQTHECELTPTRGTAKGSFSITAAGPGRLWVGAASLMPADNMAGFRRGVVEATRLSQPPTFRWPGGNMASGYHWRDGIGPRDRRPIRWDRAWNAWYDNDMGTDEFIEYCRLFDAEPCICVNAGEGTAEEAAAWVEYCNGSADTPMGRLRAANGHPEPFRVKYWDVGNEIYGNWQLGHVPPEQYGLRAVEFARAMRAVDPDIVLIASGVLEHDFDDWNRRMLRICGPFMDMLSVHDYTRYDARQCNDRVWAKVVGAPARLERRLKQTARIAEAAAGKRLPLTFDEWNSAPQGDFYGHGMPDAIYAAGIFHAMQRLGDDVPIGNLALQVNVLGALRTDQTRVMQTPTFFAFRLFADHSGVWDAAVTTRCESFRKLPTVDAAATLSEDKATLHVTLINRHPRRAAAVEWNLGALKPTGDAEVTTLAGLEPWARNSLEFPEIAKLHKERLSWAEFAKRPLPPASVVGVSVRVR